MSRLPLLELEIFRYAVVASSSFWLLLHFLCRSKEYFSDVFARLECVCSELVTSHKTCIILTYCEEHETSEARIFVPSSCQYHCMVALDCKPVQLPARTEEPVTIILEYRFCFKYYQITQLFCVQ